MIYVGSSKFPCFVFCSQQVWLPNQWSFILWKVWDRIPQTYTTNICIWWYRNRMGQHLVGSDYSTTPAFSPYINISTSHSSACSTTFSINVWRSFGQIWHRNYLNFIFSHDSDCLSQLTASSLHLWACEKNYQPSCLFGPATHPGKTTAWEQ